MSACATSKAGAEIVLPPKPQREEQPKVETIKDAALLINYYEHLVQQWEQWGKTVDNMISE